jgi:hypothetical protein
LADHSSNWDVIFVNSILHIIEQFQIYTRKVMDLILRYIIVCQVKFAISVCIIIIGKFL